MAWGTLRFIQNGWIEKLFFEPEFYFKYQGFSWVGYPGDIWMYPLFILMTMSALGIMLGLFYRISIISFFLTFTYAELLDATNYLNHHYLVAIFAFFLIFVPANRAFSLDEKFGLVSGRAFIPSWQIDVFKIQIVIVYTYAGIAKINSDWLIHGMPLSIWLPEHADMPVLGSLFEWQYAGVMMSWCGMLYDISIGYLLLWKPSRLIAYLLVVVFHLITFLLFNIGLFPFIMIFSNVIFFSEGWHKKLYDFLKYEPPIKEIPLVVEKLWAYAFGVFLVFQLLIPLRHVMYDGDVVWNEQGYRFSWRVMLVEKVGRATFTVTDKETGRYSEIINSTYLTEFQEKQMSIQPDFMKQFAEHIKKEYQTKHGFRDTEVNADVNVTLNSRPSQKLFDPSLNLLHNRSITFTSGPQIVSVE